MCLYFFRVLEDSRDVNVQQCYSRTNQATLRVIFLAVLEHEQEGMEGCPAMTQDPGHTMCKDC